MDEPRLYEIRVEGHLPERWSHWFAGLAIHNELHAETTLRGCLADQAALFGVLTKLHALNLILIAVDRVALAASPYTKTEKDKPRS